MHFCWASPSDTDSNVLMFTGSLPSQGHSNCRLEGRNSGQFFCHSLSLTINLEGGGNVTTFYATTHVSKRFTDMFIGHISVSFYFLGTNSLYWHRGLVLHGGLYLATNWFLPSNLIKLRVFSYTWANSILYWWCNIHYCIDVLKMSLESCSINAQNVRLLYWHIYSLYIYIYKKCKDEKLLGITFYAVMMKMKQQLVSHTHKKAYCY